MHRHALSPRDVADNLLSADGIAAARAIDQQLVVALHLDRRRITTGAKYAADHAGQSAIGLFFRHRLRGWVSARWRYSRQHLPRGKFSVADARHQLRCSAHTIFGSDTLKFFLVDV